MKPYFILAGVMAAVLSGAHAGSLYRWVDQSGKVHYGDVPAAGTAQVEKVKISDSPAVDDADLPYETRRAKENFPVTLYVADNCGEPCRQARDFLNQRGIPFSEKNLVTKEEIDTFKLMSGSENSPTLAIGKNWLKGFLAEQWSNELDVAGYPKIPPYRPQAATKPPIGKSATEKPAPEAP